MNKVRLSKKERARRRRINKTLRMTGVVISLIQLVVSIVFMVFLHNVELIPITYEILIGIILVLFTFFVLVTQRWKVPGVLTKILSLVMVVVLVMGSVYLDVTKTAIKKISGDSHTVSKMCIYVMKDSPADKLDDLTGKKCGVLENIDTELTQNMKNHIANDASVKLEYKGYVGMTATVDGMYKGEVDAIIMNESYVSAIIEMEGYADFLDKTKVIYTKDFEIAQESGNNEKVRLNKDIMTVYFSGIDTEGKPTAKSRSDVNIIATINFKTHQVLMINTPRDYYVPLSVSNGVRDKLTHAGIYGVDVSIDTLSMLYGINIDYYVRVNFTGFEKIIDAIGGVTVYSDYEFVTLNHCIPIKKGENHLNGLEALGFARERYFYADGDNQRGKNHMMIIQSIVDTMSSPAMLANYTELINIISENVITDMPYSEISQIAKLQINENPKWQMQVYSVKGIGAMRTTYSMGGTQLSVQLPDEYTIKIAKEMFKRINSNEIIDVDAIEYEMNQKKDSTGSSS